MKWPGSAMSAFTRVRSPYLKGVYARLRGLWTGVNAFEDALMATSGLRSLTSGRRDAGCAGRSRVEGPGAFLGLLEPPALREEPLHVHLPVGDELGALGLALLRERPRPHQRDLPAQEIRADVERDLTPLADETGGAPRAYG